jgi:hypothetical protein
LRNEGEASASATYYSLAVASAGPTGRLNAVVFGLLPEHTVPTGRRYPQRTLDVLLALEITKVVAPAWLIQQVIVEVGLVRQYVVQTLQVAARVLDRCPHPLFRQCFDFNAEIRSSLNVQVAPVVSPICRSHADNDNPG